MVKEMHSANKEPNEMWMDVHLSHVFTPIKFCSSRFWEPTYCSSPTNLLEGEVFHNNLEAQVLGDSVDITEQLSPTSSHDATNE